MHKTIRVLRSIAPAILLATVLAILGCARANQDEAALGPSPQPPQMPGTTAPDATAPAPGEMESPAESKPAGAEEVMAESDPFAVPEGPPEEIFAFLERLENMQPPQDPAAMSEYGRKLGEALATAGERILRGEPTEEQAEDGLRYRLAGLAILEQVGEEGIEQRREAVAAELQAAGFDGLIGVLEEEALERRYRQLGPDRASIVRFAQDLAAHFEKNPAGFEGVRWALSTMQAVEQFAEAEEAAALYERFGKAFSQSEDELAAQYGAMMSGSARRLTLVGNEMPLEGKTLDGEPLDWSKYEGKVVLVDFWATWCGPCLAEIPVIQENYERFGPKGFEVIGISTDQSRGDLENFLKDNELPWIVLFDQALEAEDKETMAVRYGVMSIPSLVLIGKDGKVVALNPRGHQLAEVLEGLLGTPAEEDAAEAAPKPKEKPEAEEKKPVEEKPAKEMPEAAQAEDPAGA